MIRSILFAMTALVLAALLPISAVAATTTPTDTTDTIVEEDPPLPDDYYGTDSAKARFVGISGGIILGAEVVMTAQAAFGVDKLWPYLVFPVLGAAGGGVGGYYLEKQSVPGSVALLVLGIAAVIPTAIITASAFAYDPEKDGAIVDNAEQLSFERPPAATSADQKAVTEVDAPETEGPPDTSPGETTPPAAPEETPESAAPESEKTSRRTSHRPGLASGVLFELDETGRPGLGIPAIDIRPDVVTDRDGMVLARGTVAVTVSLLRVYLP